MKLKKPLAHCVITQPFGVNYVRKGFYKKLGYPNDTHQGLDLRLTSDAKIFAVTSGRVENGFSKTGGNFIKLYHEEEGITYKFRYFHLEKHLVKNNEYVRAGQLIAIGGNTGTATTGPHLHLDLRVYDEYNHIIKYANGLLGYIDPTPYFDEDYTKLPIDLKYGKEMNWKIELAFRFAGVPSWVTRDPMVKLQIKKGQWVHRQLQKMPWRPSILSYREMNAVIYGSWSFEEALDPSLFPISAFLTKAEFKKGKEPPIRLSI